MRPKCAQAARGAAACRPKLVAAIAAVNLADLAILAVLVAARGWTVAAFALAGLFVSVFYVAPPLRLKHHGLGEPGVVVVWGRA